MFLEAYDGSSYLAEVHRNEDSLVRNLGIVLFEVDLK